MPMPTQLHMDVHRWILDQAASLPRQQKRALAEMNPNVMASTPRKRRSKSNPPTDTDATPRARLTSLQLRQDVPQVLPSPSSQTFLNLSKRARDDTDSDISSRPSKSSRRSQSPQKKIASWQFARYPVKQATLRDWATVPQDVKDTVKYFKHLKQGNAAVLPTTCDRLDFRTALSEGDAEEDERLFAVLFDVTRNTDSVPTLAWAKKMVARSCQNRSRVVSEAHWNSIAHHAILDEALQGSQHSQKLACDNITTAAISTTALSADNSIDSCKVDFCISLELDTLTQKSLAAADIPFLNHTDYWPTRYSPIAISIETKADQGSTPTARVQLSTWAQAQIFSLRALLYKVGNSNVAIPPLPLVLAEGDVWTIWCFRDMGGEDGGTFFSDGIEFGSTASVLGCYQVIAGLQYLAKWAEEVWRVWYYKEILGLILKPLDRTKTQDDLT